MYEAPTIAEAARRWHVDALPRVSALARAFGVPFELGNHRWHEHSSIPGEFFKDKSRDRVAFHTVRTEKIRRIIHDIIPDGELKNELAVADEAGPNDYDTVERLGWARGTTANHTDTNSQTHGWSVVVSAGFEVGGDAQGGKVIGGLEIGAHGDYSKETAEDKGKSIEAHKETEVALPKGQVARLMQTVRTGRGIAKVEDRIVLELGWRVADWKSPTNDNLKNHSGFARKGNSKSRWHWDCTDTDDLRTLGDGNNPRYPGLKGRVRDRGDVRQHLEWLMNEGNRTILVKSDAIFDMSVFGSGRVLRIDEHDTVVEDRPAE